MTSEVGTDLRVDRPSGAGHGECRISVMFVGVALSEKSPYLESAWVRLSLWPIRKPGDERSEEISASPLNRDRLKWLPTNRSLFRFPRCMSEWLFKPTVFMGFPAVVDSAGTRNGPEGNTKCHATETNLGVFVLQPEPL